MDIRRRCTRWLVAALAALVAFVGLAVRAGADPPPGRGKPITVMTRNLYLGGDFSRPLRAVQGVPPEQQLAAFIAANTTLRAIAQIMYPSSEPDDALCGDFSTRAP